MRCVRPALTTDSNAVRLVGHSATASTVSAGISSNESAAAAAMWIDVGNTSLEDCDALTWSFGCTGSAEQLGDASVAMTSLAFMFDDVPEPVWNTSIGNWSSCTPGGDVVGSRVEIAAAMSAGSTPSDRSPPPPRP